jgi:hypothetical protein
VIEPPHPVVIPIAARSAVKLVRMRYVLGISLAMVIVLLIDCRVFDRLIYSDESAPTIRDCPTNP